MSGTVMNDIVHPEMRNGHSMATTLLEYFPVLLAASEFQVRRHDVPRVARVRSSSSIVRFAVRRDLLLLGLVDHVGRSERQVQIEKARQFPSTDAFAHLAALSGR